MLFENDLSVLNPYRALSDKMFSENEGVGVRTSAIKKFQITNTKQITMTEIQNFKQLAFDLI
jgi:hypothetical protein